MARHLFIAAIAASAIALSAPASAQLLGGSGGLGGNLGGTLGGTLGNPTGPIGGTLGSAGELTAVAYLKMGRRDRAAELFSSLTRDPVVPESIRMRAAQMASMLGSPVAAAPAAPAPAAQ